MTVFADVKAKKVFIAVGRRWAPEPFWLALEKEHPSSAMVEEKFWPVNEELVLSLRLSPRRIKTTR